MEFLSIGQPFITHRFDPSTSSGRRFAQCEPSHLPRTQVLGNSSFVLHVKCPFSLTHDRFAPAIFLDAVNVHLRGADHKVHVVQADIPAALRELFIAQFFTARECEAIGTSDGDVAGGILVKERVVEEMSALCDGGAGRYKRHFTETVRALICIHQFLQDGLTFFRAHLYATSIFK